MKYFKRHWDESRGDEYDHWGTSWWYFEVDEEAWIVRQIEVYENGRISKYGGGFPDDKYGGLGDQQMDLEEFEAYTISAEEFELAWAKK